MHESVGPAGERASSINQQQDTLVMPSGKASPGFLQNLLGMLGRGYRGFDNWAFDGYLPGGGMNPDARRMEKVGKSKERAAASSQRGLFEEEDMGGGVPVPRVAPRRGLAADDEEGAGVPAPSLALETSSAPVRVPATVRGQGEDEAQDRSFGRLSVAPPQRNPLALAPPDDETGRRGAAPAGNPMQTPLDPQAASAAFDQMRAGMGGPDQNPQVGPQARQVGPEGGPHEAIRQRLTPLGQYLQAKGGQMMGQAGQFFGNAGNAQAAEPPRQGTPPVVPNAGYEPIPQIQPGGPGQPPIPPNAGYIPLPPGQEAVTPPGDRQGALPPAQNPMGWDPNNLTPQQLALLMSNPMLRQQMGL